MLEIYQFHFLITILATCIMLLLHTLSKMIRLLVANCYTIEDIPLACDNDKAYDKVRTLSLLKQCFKSQRNS